MRSPLGITLTGSQAAAIRRVVNLLEAAGICYQFTGGFAGNLHGSSWPLHDVDLDVARQDLPRLAALLHSAVIRPLSLYEDAEFRMELMQARLEGIDIDITQAEDAYGHSGGQWIRLETDLSRRQRVPIPELDLGVWVQPLEDLIDYKLLIGRHADATDLRGLRKKAPENLRQPLDQTEAAW